MLAKLSILVAALLSLTSVSAAPAATVDAAPVEARACGVTLRNLEWTAIGGRMGPYDQVITGTTDSRLETYDGDGPWLGALTANLHGIGAFNCHIEAPGGVPDIYCGHVIQVDSAGRVSPGIGSVIPSCNRI